MKNKSSNWFPEECEFLRRYQQAMDVMAIDWGYERSQTEWFVIPIASIFIRDYYLQYTNFMSLSDKESVIVSPVITAHTLRKNGEFKTASVFIRRPRNILGGENIFDVDCWDSSTQKQESQKLVMYTGKKCQWGL